MQSAECRVQNDEQSVSYPGNRHQSLEDSAMCYGAQRSLAPVDQGSAAAEAVDGASGINSSDPVVVATPIPRLRSGVRMEIQTSRFGWMSVDEERIMTFPRGLLGFPNHSRFALIQTGQENYFFWLQSVDDPNLAFVVTDPTIFFKDYQVPVREEVSSELQLSDPTFVQVFAICNKVGEWLTGNLLGPIVVNAENRLATQVVLTEKKWTTRQPLMRLAAEVPLAKSA